MKVKRYIGETTQDAFNKVKMDLGKNAIILNTRKIRRKGIAGFFMKPLIEVVATIDSNNVDSTKTNNRNSDIFSKQLSNKMVEVNNISKENNNKVLDEMSEIRNMLVKVYENVNSENIEKNMTDTVKLYIDRLKKHEIDNEIIKQVKVRVTEDLSQDQQNDNNAVRQKISSLLSSYIPSLDCLKDIGSNRVIVFLGPTGVGKTTTLAKLTARFVIYEKKKVGLITSDTYRIAAVDQLKTYSEIIGVPLSIAYTPNEFIKHIQEFSNNDIILVDTAGVSHRDKYQLTQLKSVLDTGNSYEIYLVLSATTKNSDCIDIIKSYNFLDNYKILFTKLDETSSYGVIYNVSYQTQKPINYVTTGQNVPDDIEVFDDKKIIDCILGDRLYERSS